MILPLTIPWSHPPNSAILPESVFHGEASAPLVSPHSLHRTLGKREDYSVEASSLQAGLTTKLLHSAPLQSWVERGFTSEDFRTEFERRIWSDFSRAMAEYGIFS
ncbi:unnamed protein product [Allacma fusca]|uniref:Uncharacterized protein n=1 Tax=Allacma fusca TaxID=39272 RepID=A0A8J2P5E5_9HEXA|nr:unnamed protein product [Allacma fusca]